MLLVQVVRSGDDWGKRDGRRAEPPVKALLDFVLWKEEQAPGNSGLASATWCNDI